MMENSSELFILAELPCHLKNMITYNAIALIRFRLVH